MQGIGRLSFVAASAAQSAANVVQAGTKEFTSKVFLGNFGSDFSFDCFASWYLTLVNDC